MADNLPQIADLVADALDLSGAEIDSTLGSAPLVSRLPFIPSSDGIYHRYTLEVANPEVGFTPETGGRDFDHSIDQLAESRLSILDFSFAVRKSVADAWRRARIRRS